MAGYLEKLWKVPQVFMVVEFEQGHVQLLRHSQPGHFAQERDPERGRLEDVVVEAQVHHKGDALGTVRTRPGQALDCLLYTSDAADE